MTLDPVTAGRVRSLLKKTGEALSHPSGHFLGTVSSESLGDPA